MRGNDFLKLSNMLDDRYVIVLVGLSKKQIKRLPKQMLGLERTDDVLELVEIYSAANIFVNPSREETFGMTTVEAAMCGAYTIVYDNTACAEIARQNKGIVVPYGVENIYQAIIKLTRDDFGINSVG